MEPWSGMSSHPSHATFVTTRRRPRQNVVNEVQVANAALYRPPHYPTASAYVVPAPILLAAATMSLVVLRKFIPSKHPLSKFVRRGLYWQRKCQRSILQFMANSRRQMASMFSPSFSQSPPVPAASSSATPSPTLDEISAKLDDLRDRALAKLDSSLSITSTPKTQSTLTSAEYEALQPSERRDLLASGFADANGGTISILLENDEELDETVIVDKVNRSVSDNFKLPGKRLSSIMPSLDRGEATKQNGGRLRPFWRSIESLNGRIAAVGFVLCLAREVLEPGHPSLYDQVEDVLVPIAISTPPFLVAVCDKIADLLT